MKVMHAIQAYDVSLFMWVTRRKTRNTLVRIARLVSRTGDGHLYLLLGLWLAIPDQADHATLLSSLCMGFALERPVYFVLKNLCRRDRPPVALNIPGFVIPSDRFSFPSGHTSAAFLVASLLGSYYPAIAPLLITWATLVGMSRVILGVHFPTDTLIGALMGASLGFAGMEAVLS